MCTIMFSETVIPLEYFFTRMTNSVPHLTVSWCSLVTKIICRLASVIEWAIHMVYWQFGVVLFQWKGYIHLCLKSWNSLVECSLAWLGLSKYEQLQSRISMGISLWVCQPMSSLVFLSKHLGYFFSCYWQKLNICCISWMRIGWSNTCHEVIYCTVCSSVLNRLTHNLEQFVLWDVTCNFCVYLSGICDVNSIIIF